MKWNKFFVIFVLIIIIIWISIFVYKQDNSNDILPSDSLPDRETSQDYETIQDFLTDFATFSWVFVDPINEPFIIKVPREWWGVVYKEINYQLDKQYYAIEENKNKLIQDILSAYEIDWLYGHADSKHEKKLQLAPAPK